MSFDPEENLLDESLRETFRDYYLPPAEHMHVWDGVEKRIATLAAPRKGLLSYRLVLPLTAALGVGVAVGWLLPRPALPPPPPRSVPAVHATAWAATRPVATPQATPAPVARPVPALGPATIKASAISHLTGSGDHRVADAKPAVQATVAVARPAAPVGTAPVPAATSFDLAAPEAAHPGLVAPAAGLTPDDSSLTTLATANPPAPTVRPEAGTAEADAPAEITAHAAKAAKPEGANERMLYRKPTHRQPERGVGGIRRWFSHLTQSIRHIFQ